jgi:hypothetical protein
MLFASIEGRNKVVEGNASFLVASQYFYPEPGATSELLSRVVFELSKRGFNFRVIAGQPNYYRKFNVPWLLNCHGVNIRRLRSTRLNKNSLMGRMLNSTSFALRVLTFLLLDRKREILVSVTNPPLLVWVCWLARFFRAKKYVLLIHDIYPEIAEELGALSCGGFIAWLWRILNSL